MAVSPIEVTGFRPDPALPEVPGPGAEPPAHPRTARRRGTRLALPVALAVLALPLITAAHHSRPAPYGDHLTVHARVRAAATPARVAPARDAAPPVRTRGQAVEAYDAVTGRAHWTYAREGRRPLRLLTASGHAFTLWDDGLVTDTARRPAPGGVRWHRAIPAAASWLRGPGTHRADGVLQPLDPGARMLAVVTPHRVAAYRTADGDLRWVLPARRGCAFEPARSVRHGSALLLAQPCPGEAASWTAQLVAVDGLGRITPRRTPLGNDLPGAPGDVPDREPRPPHERSEKLVAHPR